MPFGIHKHSNRSKQALNDSAAQGTNSPSSGSGATSPVPGSHSTDETRPNQPQPFTPQPSRADAQSYATTPSPAPDPRVQRKSGDLPTRSQSTRHPSAYHQQQAQQPQVGVSVENLVDTRRHQRQQERERALQTLQTPATVETKKKGNIFERMRNSTSRTSEPKTPTSGQSSYSHQSGLARRLSKRQETPPLLRTSQVGNSPDQQRPDRQSASHGSRSHLPSPREENEDESGLDPYLITEPRQELAHTPVAQEASQYQTIRPVQDDTETLAYSDDDKYQQFEAQQHLRTQLHHNHQRSESNSHNYYSPQDLAHAQHQGNFSGSTLVAGDLYRQQNPETVSQLSYDSPIEQREEQRPISVHSSHNGQSPTGLGLQRAEYPNRTSSIPAGRPLSTYAAMAPQAGAGQQNRRPEPKQSLQVNQGQGTQDSRDGPPPNYSRGQFQGNQAQSGGVSPLPPTSGAQSSNYRGGPSQRDQYPGVAGSEQGRSTPPPALNDRDVNDAYKELLTKYKKVKGLYFDKTAQVESLQNTLANQRLSQSRTSLDDSEYMTRFQRLDGATINLAFNIRKDWRQIPTWLSQYVNQDALRIGKQEMTAVGRACITKFLVDEVFNRTFHPGLEGELSIHLKSIEQNIRRFSPALNNQEESDALTAKVVQWRLATLEGLRDSLNSPDSEDYKNQYIRVATTNLTASLINLLNEPIPVGIEDSAHMIVELAVSIAANLPLESRDISIVYPLPGDLFQPFIMKVDSVIPALENPGLETTSEGDTASTNSGEKEDASSKEGEKTEGNKLRKEKPKSTGGMLQAMMGSGNSGGSVQSKKSVQGQADSSNEGKKASMEDGAQKVRFAGFVGVEVRGRQVLAKAPVWTVGN